jgi:hypothetical protein
VAGEGYWDQNFSELDWSLWHNAYFYYDIGLAHLAIGPNGDIIGVASPEYDEENTGETMRRRPKT